MSLHKGCVRDVGLHVQKICSSLMLSTLCCDFCSAHEASSLQRVNFLARTIPTNYLAFEFIQENECIVLCNLTKFQIVFAS